VILGSLESMIVIGAAGERGVCYEGTHISDVRRNLGYGGESRPKGSSIPMVSSAVVCVLSASGQQGDTKE